MKLLPKKEIDKQKADERKRLIDEGMALAKSVDKLRETRAIEEKNLREWRLDNVTRIQQEIESYLEVKENLRKETEAMEALRKKLIEPLDKEWEEINKIKQELGINNINKK